MIIFDLDGTLADCEHRRHFVDPSKNPNLWKPYQFCETYTKKQRHQWFTKNPNKEWKPDWQAFYEACDKDLINEAVVQVYESLIFSALATPEIQIWSGRCESVREKTLNWLIEHCFWSTANRGYLSETLKMRPIGDYTPDEQLKERWLDEILTEGKKVDFVFDDRPKVVQMWRRRGIFVFDVNQSGEDF